MHQTKHHFIVALLLALIVLPAASLWAAPKPKPTPKPKPNIAQWESLQMLARGTPVQVVLNDAKSYTGKFKDATADILVVDVETHDQTFTRESVLRVSTKSGSHRMRNAAIGAGIGVGLGFAIAAAANQNDPEARDIAYAVGVPATGATGALIGALLPSNAWRDVYRAR